MEFSGDVQVNNTKLTLGIHIVTLYEWHLGTFFEDV